MGKSKKGCRASREADGSAIGVYKRIPDETIKAWVADFKLRLREWWKANPTRKICKVDWCYGRSIDLRRETCYARIDRETEKILSKPNALRDLRGGTPSRPASGSGMLLDCEGCWTHSIPIEDCDGDNCPLCGSTMLMEQGDQFDASVWGGGHNRIYVPNPVVRGATESRTSPPPCSAGDQT